MHNLAMIPLENYFRKLRMPIPSLFDATSEEKIIFLRTLYHAHIQAFPYSNFELRKIARQHPIERAPLSFFNYKKLLSTQHGGYCFQTATLFSDVLAQLGYKVRSCAARVLLGAAVNSPEILALPPTHLVLVVSLDEKHFLLDPGLGASAPLYPILITGKRQSIAQDEEEFKFYPEEGVHVLEKKTKKGWYRLMQTDLTPLTEKQIKMNLLKLERYPEIISIRDTKTVIGIITKQGRKSLIWDALSKQLKYTKTEKEVSVEKVLADFNEGYKILVEEFDITHISALALKTYCHEIVLPRPIKPWTVDFPLDKKELKKMECNLKF